nr:DUF6252 family protein [uncultured Allomuricauda sp.]
MKRIYLISGVLLFVFLGIVSCSKDDNQIEADFIVAKINSENWKGIPEVNLNAVNDTLILLGVGNEEVVVFKIKFNGKGVYNLSGTQSSYYTTVGGDVITSLYILEDDLTSHIIISDYSPEQNVIRGNFKISLLQDWSNPENNINSLSFTQGEFKGTINN